ncbi:MAG: hypothetical protein ACOCQG_01715 [Candidatus Nanoarchaeia archaeon]
MNTIVIAALVVLILVIVTMVFMGQFGQFTESVGECRNRGGEVMSAEKCDDEGGMPIMHIDNGDNGDNDDEKVCCSVNT